MVEYGENMNAVFSALADTTRRDILRRTLVNDHTISSLAKSYQMSFAAVAKHVNILFSAKLILKYKVGREQIIKANVETLEETRALLESYEALWTDRFDTLDALLPHI